MIASKANRAKDLISLMVQGSWLPFSLLSPADLGVIREKLCDKSSKDFAINIVASGPSIREVVFDSERLSTPTIFVNGSITLLDDYRFNQPLAYVVSDERFIAHNFGLIEAKFKQGLLFCMTLPVLMALIEAYPSFVTQFYSSFRLIFAIDRPIVQRTGVMAILLHRHLPFYVQKNALKQTKNYTSDKFVFDWSHEPVVGVSLDITQGFVEAGTVAYVAAQLAYGFKPAAIHLYGIDLMNSQQPRFYETEQNKAPIKLDKAIVNRIVPSFDLLAQTYQAKNITIFNHSPISKSLFQQVKFLT